MSHVRGHETPQVKRERGFYRDPDPRFKDFKGKFEAASRSNGERQVKEAAIRHVLAKFALLDEAGNPIDGLTEIIRGDDFGYTKRRAGRPARMSDEKPVWGPPSGLGAGWTADQLGWNQGVSYGGV